MCEFCASTILAEIGSIVDDVFEIDAHLASYAGLCPSPDESAEIENLRISYKELLHQTDTNHVRINSSTL